VVAQPLDLRALVELGLGSRASAGSRASHRRLPAARALPQRFRPSGVESADQLLLLDCPAPGDAATARST